MKTQEEQLQAAKMSQMSKTLPTTLPVTQITRENHRTVTLSFESKLGKVKPGQFVMLWLPGVDEKPVSVAYADEKKLQLTVSAVGPWSQQIQQVKVGDLLGLRGPYGNGFKIKKSQDRQRVLLVGGGFGVAPLYFWARHLQDELLATVEFIIGARNSQELLYVKKISSAADKAWIMTDDGSAGEKGFTTVKLEQLLKQNTYDCIYSCGPEVMMKKVAELAATASTKSQLSLERYMKCGFGLCGSCCLDDSGVRVCADGTIFAGDQLLSLAEFGAYHRDSVGERI